MNKFSGAATIGKINQSLEVTIQRTIKTRFNYFYFYYFVNIKFFTFTLFLNFRIKVIVNSHGVIKL